MSAAAAESEVTIKVALTDMSSAMGMGPAGRGMMGRGMMSPGQGMMGSGPGGQGWAHPGMMGRGMMDGGMMGGMMALRIGQSSVKAGTIRFDIVNWSRGMLHEMLVVAVDDPQAPLTYDYSQEKVVEDQVKVMGDTGDLRPNQSHSLDVTPDAGNVPPDMQYRWPLRCGDGRPTDSYALARPIRRASNERMPSTTRSSMMTYHFSTTVEQSFDAAVAATTEALKRHGFRVLTEFDVQGAARW
jgi:hypothetical protein